MVYYVHQDRRDPESLNKTKQKLEHLCRKFNWKKSKNFWLNGKSV